MKDEVTENIAGGLQEMKMVGTERDDDDIDEASHRLSIITAHGMNGRWKKISKSYE